MKGLVIFGATSAIAVETGKLFAAEGCPLLLVARDPQKLAVLQQDFTLRGAPSVVVETADLADCSGHEALMERVRRRMPEFDAVLVAYGALGEQQECERNFEAAERVLRINFISVVSLLTPIANLFAERKDGVIAVIGSVAGDRGRASNYVYGAAKGALALFLQGLRNRLHRQGVTVLTIKPGFVDTPMTAALPKGRLFVGPDVIAGGIVKAMRSRRNVVYLPWFWRWIMLVIVHVPEWLFKRQTKI